jgi:hypothetical protein
VVVLLEAFAVVGLSIVVDAKADVAEEEEEDEVPDERPTAAAEEHEAAEAFTLEERVPMSIRLRKGCPGSFLRLGRCSSQVKELRAYSSSEGHSTRDRDTHPAPATDPVKETPPLLVLPPALALTLAFALMHDCLEPEPLLYLSEVAYVSAVEGLEGVALSIQISSSLSSLAREVP